MVGANPPSPVTTIILEEHNRTLKYAMYVYKAANTALAASCMRFEPNHNHLV